MFLMPPSGLDTFPFLFGIKCMWQWSIVWPASSPLLKPILNPEIELSSFFKWFLIWCTNVRSDASFEKDYLKGKYGALQFEEPLDKQLQLFNP